MIGHLRYWLESIGPEMRQYFGANNREELPFNRIESIAEETGLPVGIKGAIGKLDQ